MYQKRIELAAYPHITVEMYIIRSEQFKHTFPFELHQIPPEIVACLDIIFKPYNTTIGESVTFYIFYKFIYLIKRRFYFIRNDPGQIKSINAGALLAI